MSTSDLKTAAGNLNTVLLAVTLAVLSWIGYTTQQTATSVAVLAEKGVTQDREILDLRARVAAVEIQLAQIRRTP